MKKYMYVVLALCLLVSVARADTINWTFDSASVLNDFDHTSGVTVDSDSYGSWVDIISSNESFEYMASNVKVAPSASEWTRLYTSYSEVRDIPADEDWPMWGFVSDTVDAYGDPTDFIQIEANPHRQLEIFMRSASGTEQYLTIEQASY